MAVVVLIQQLQLEGLLFTTLLPLQFLNATTTSANMISTTTAINHRVLTFELIQ